LSIQSRRRCGHIQELLGLARPLRLIVRARPICALTNDITFTA